VFWLHVESRPNQDFQLFNFLLSHEKSTNVDSIYFCWKVSYLSFLKPSQATSYDFSNNLNEISNNLYFFNIFMILKKVVFHAKIMLDSKLQQFLVKGWLTRLWKAKTSYFMRNIIWSTLVDLKMPYFLLNRNFLKILKNQHFYDFTTSPTIENNQQVLTKIIFVEKYDISASWIPIERNSRILQTQSTISSKFACFFWQNKSEKSRKFIFIKFLGRQHLLTKWKLCCLIHMGLVPLIL